MYSKPLLIAGAFMCFLAYAPLQKLNSFTKNDPNKKTNTTTTVTKKAETTENWKYHVIKDTMTVRIIEYYKAHSYCGEVTAKSMAICIDNKGDTLRIIELCPGPKDYKTGDVLEFYPYSHITQNKKTYEKYKMSDEHIEQYRFNSVCKTTFAKLTRRGSL